MRSSVRNTLAIGAIALAVGLGSGLGAASAQAQLPRQTPESRQQVMLSFAPVVQRATPAVVNVYGLRQERRAANPFMDDPFFRRFFGDGGFGVPRERAQQSLGSGVIVDAGAGLVVTNHHVIEGMTEVKVALADRREVEADIILRDPRTDLAVLRLKRADGLSSALEIGNSDDLQVGDIVLAIGNPFGVGQTVTQGIVSALARTQVGIADFQSFIQTDAAINPGNSGGALIDMQGRLIGINTAIFSKTGASHGIGFAIPATMVRIVVESARAGSGMVRRPWFGARMQGVTADIAEGLGLDRPTGVVVAAVFDKSPAAEAGLRRGDVILQLDGQQIDDPDSFGYRLATRQLGSTAQVSVMRGRSRLVLPVKMAVAPETRPRDPVTITGRVPLSGLTVVNISPAVAEELSIDVTAEGVAISDVQADSAAAQIGFQKGDLILAVNRDRVSNSRDLDRLMRERARGWEITLNRKGQVFTTYVRG
ncbi:MAG: Do family serine endopeptidase [Bosea sp.]|jgi:Do/DeqQ family serine protease|nr:Do family serine endopeptidase [Bosea sp. (in: a-proteobacteria)]